MIIRDRARTAPVDNVTPLPNSPPVEPFPLLGLGDMLAMPKPRWRIKGVLPQTGIGIMFGESGAKKTFAAVDWACHIAHGMNWQGNRVKQCGVLYVASEDPGGIAAQRIPGWHLCHGMMGTTPPLMVVPCPVEITDHKQVERLLVTIRRAVELCGFDVGIVVIDTLARSFGGDENSGEAMGKFLKGCGEIQREIDGLVLIVHHSGWSASERTRGHSSLWAATDARYQVESAKGSRDVCLKVLHLKNGNSGDDYELYAETVELGEDEDGDMVTTLALRATEGTKPQGGVPKLSEKEKIILSALTASGCTGINYSEWWTESHRAGIGSKATFGAAVKTLQSCGFCVQDKAGQYFLNAT